MSVADTTTEAGSDTAAIAGARPAAITTKPTKRRSHVATRPQLLTRQSLDQRTNAFKIFTKIVSDIETDLGGADRLSTIEHALIEGFAGAALTLHNLNCRLALGLAIDLGQHAQAVSAMVRVASRLGVSRRARTIEPTLSDIMRGPPIESNNK